MEESILTVVAALNNIVRLTRNDDSGSTRHADNLPLAFGCDPNDVAVRQIVRVGPRRNTDAECAAAEAGAAPSAIRETELVVEGEPRAAAQNTVDPEAGPSGSVGGDTP